MCSTVLSNAYIHLNICTSPSDIPALFDYDLLKLQYQKFKIQKSSVILYNESTAETKIITLEKYSNKHDSQIFKPVFKIRINQSYHKNVLIQPFLSQFHPSSNKSKNSYIIARFAKRSDQKKGYQLKCGDVIKLGRIQYIVVQSNINSKIQKFKDIGFTKESYIYDKDPILSGVCKICFSEQTSASNYLMNPCKCKGSCEFIHVNCLKKWIDSKVKAESNGISITYNLNKFQCELCKFPFPTLIKNGNQTIQTIKMQKPKRSYIILESLNYDKQSKDKSLHIIFPNQNFPVKLGRNSDCHIKITDPSISRIHSIITLEQNKFIIYDKNSKFGTLVRLENEVKLESDLHLQCDKSTYSLRIE